MSDDREAKLWLLGACAIDAALWCLIFFVGGMRVFLVAGGIALFIVLAFIGMFTMDKFYDQEDE